MNREEAIRRHPSHVSFDELDRRQAQLDYLIAVNAAEPHFPSVTAAATAIRRAAFVDALAESLKYWTEDPDRCDMQWREREVAEHLVDDVLIKMGVIS